MRHRARRSSGLVRSRSLVALNLPVAGLGPVLAAAVAVAIAFAIPNDRAGADDAPPGGQAPPKPLAPAAAVPWREEVPPEARAAAERGVRWLLKKQFGDGSWGCGDPETPASAGITGLCVLALMSSGSTPQSGPHHEPLRDAVDWLLAHQNRDGALRGEYVTEMGIAFDHSSATLALCMASGMHDERADEFAACLRSAEGFLARRQAGDGGFSRHEGRGDAMVTAHAWLAFRALHSVGGRVRLGHAPIEKFAQRAAGPWLRANFAGRLSGSSEINDAVGWYRIQLGLGKGEDPTVKRLGDRLARRYLSADRPEAQEGGVSEWDYVAAFHLAQALLHESDDGRGAGWRIWYPAAARYLVSIQDPDGSWSIVNCVHCKAFATALAICVIETPRRLLPALGL